MDWRVKFNVTTKCEVMNLAHKIVERCVCLSGKQYLHKEEKTADFYVKPLPS